MNLWGGKKACLILLLEMPVDFSQSLYQSCNFYPAAGYGLHLLVRMVMTARWLQPGFDGGPERLEFACKYSDRRQCNVHVASSLACYPQLHVHRTVIQQTLFPPVKEMVAPLLETSPRSEVGHHAKPSQLLWGSNMSAWSGNPGGTRGWARLPAWQACRPLYHFVPLTWSLASHDCCRHASGMSCPTRSPSSMLSATAQRISTMSCARLTTQLSPHSSGGQR